jgi:GLPGLI family protein
MPDTMQRDKFRNTGILLFLSDNESYCVSSDRYFNDSLKIDGYEKLMNSNGSDMAMSKAMMPLGMRSTSSNYLIKKDRNKKLITYFTNISLEEMYYNEQIDAKKWQLVDSTIMIQGFECKLAKLKYLGRNYTAYYAPSIPVQDGPLKFCGLPGLIIKINDDLNEVKITLTSFRKNSAEAKFFQATNPIYADRKKMFDLVIQDYLNPFKTDEQLFNIRFSEETKIEMLRKRQEAMKTVNNRLEKE